jgi:elongation factor 3
MLDGEADDDEEGEDLCDCEFSLAYGGRILLSNTKLRLKRGGRYGLCGPNGAGKTTLMKAIANGQVDGFPPRSEVLTVYVAHDIQAQEDDPAVLDYLAEDEQIKTKGLAREKCRAALEQIGFDEERISLTVSTLSGACSAPNYDS